MRSFTRLALLPLLVVLAFFTLAAPAAAAEVVTNLVTLSPAEIGAGLLLAAGATVSVELATPHWDEKGKLYRPGTHSLPRELAQKWGYVQESSGSAETTALPDDFPGRQHLIAQQFGTIEAVRTLSRDQLIALQGIGETTADRILEALK